ncbi:MAG: hypothetical protein J5I94_20545 [Phaeodactylibacter sp.]|nr:hypothetical protein [Phaeodactylibacter sp.]
MINTLKEIIRLSLFLAGFALIAAGLANWFNGWPAGGKFLVATGIWLELHLFSMMQEGI